MEAQLRGDEATFMATMNAMFDAMEGPMSPGESARMRALRRPDQAVVLAIWAPVMEASAADLDALVRSFAGQVKVPYLALHGSDPGAGYRAWLADVIPQAELEVWPDEGHYPHLIERDRFVNRLEDFEDQA
jgi:pimeloyl-ACP methyl ester carboxylesterase